MPNNKINPPPLRQVSLRRLLALCRKESYQIVRDPSSILIAFVLPIILLFIFGYGINLDTNRVKLGLVQLDPGAEAQNYSTELNRLTSKVQDNKKREKFASNDEKVNCTFKPKLGSKKSRDQRGNDSNSDDEANAKEAKDSYAAFLDRQIQDDRRRRSGIENKRGKEAYDALIDKKYCPNCGGKQSYDEYKERKKKCSVCNVEFSNKIVWNNKIGKQFFARDKEFIKEKENHKKQLEDEVLDKLTSYETAAYDKEEGKVVKLVENQFKKSITWNAETQEEFNERLEQCNKKKKERFEKILAEMTYSFHPTISAKKPARKDEEDAEMEEDSTSTKKNVVQVFLNRMEQDLMKYRAIHPRVEKKVKKDLPRFKA